MSLFLYNTMTHKKEIFEPLEPGKVKLYVCGPTVYDLLHIGNFRGPIVFNMLRNWLEHLGYQVNFVLNYTDVDDKIIARALKEGVDSSEVSEKYISEYQKDYKSLGLKPHTSNPKVTEHMDDIVKLIAKIVERGHAYVVEGEVFYSIASFPEYGKLSHKNIEELVAGTRVEIDRRKKNPMDFSLWKPAKPGEPKWASPWGEGRPGWHIECSAMNCAIFGDQIDIHGGGIDLIFPHHENEIAQTEGATGKSFVKYWLHNNFINFSGEKMSKSLGNVRTVRDFVEQYDAEILKYMILSSHYRSQSDFNASLISNAVAGLARVYSALAVAEDILRGAGDLKSQPDKNFEQILLNARKMVDEAMNDDLNTPQVFAQIFEVIRAFNAGVKRGAKVTPIFLGRAENLLKWIDEVGGVMALFTNSPQEYLLSLDNRLLQEKNLQRATIDQLVAERTEARAAKDWAKSDELRKQLDGLGIAVSDTPSGSIWEVQK